MPQVILDVDTGVDDAFALLLAARHPDLDLLAVTCVAGNAPLADVVRNTRVVLGTCGRRDVPVATGAARPLLEPPARRGVHGRDGMGDLGWPVLPGPFDSRSAVELLRDVLLAAARAGRRVSVLALAPLTNVALLVRAFPDAAAGIGDLVIMGGAFGAGPGAPPRAAEFNVHQDPEAAAITLAAAHELGIPVTMYGLDVFFGPTVERARADRLVAGGGCSPSELAGRLLRFQCDRFDSDAATIGDAGAVCAVLDPGGLTTRRRRVRVQLSGDRGATVAETAEGGRPEPEVSVAVAVDGPRYAGTWLRAVS